MGDRCRKGRAKVILRMLCRSEPLPAKAPKVEQVPPPRYFIRDRTGMVVGSADVPQEQLVADMKAFLARVEGHD